MCAQSAVYRVARPDNSTRHIVHASRPTASISLLPMSTAYRGSPSSTAPSMAQSVRSAAVRVSSHARAMCAYHQTAIFFHRWSCELRTSVPNRRPSVHTKRTLDLASVCTGLRYPHSACFLASGERLFVSEHGNNSIQVIRTSDGARVLLRSAPRNFVLVLQCGLGRAALRRRRNF